MKSSLDFVWIAANICAHTGAAVLWKFAADSDHLSVRQIVLFILGNLFGLTATVFLTIALKDNNPVLIYAILAGFGAISVYFALWMIFRPPMSAWQWVAIGLIVVGAGLLHVWSPSSSSEAERPGETEPSN